MNAFQPVESKMTWQVFVSILEARAELIVQMKVSLVGSKYYIHINVSGSDVMKKQALIKINLTSAEPHGPPLAHLVSKYYLHISKLYHTSIRQCIKTCAPLFKKQGQNKIHLSTSKAAMGA